MAGGKKKSKSHRKIASREATKKKKVRTRISAQAVRTDEHVTVDPEVYPATPAAVIPAQGADISIAPKRRARLTEMVPIRFDEQTLLEVKQRAADDQRSVSSWIRRAVDVALDRPAD